MEKVTKTLLLMKIAKRLFPSCYKLLFQGEAKSEAIDRNIFLILMQIKLVFHTRESLLLALF